MLKSNCLKNNEKKKVEWIITIEIDSITMINKKIIGYQKEEIHHLILDSPSLQLLPMNAPGIKSRLMSLKELTFIKPLITPK